MNTKTKLWLYGIGALVSLSSIFTMGYCNAYPNTAIDPFKNYLNRSLSDRGQPMNDSIYAWLWSAILNVWFIGFAAGSIVAVPITDRLGRKKGLLIGNTLTLISTAVMTVAIIYEVFELLIVGRLFAAVAGGIAMCALILFLQEIAPKEIRGSMSFFAELAFVVMNAVGAVMGMNVLLGNHLGTLVGLAMVPAAFAILITIPLHETPKFLMLKQDDVMAAKKSVQFYIGLTNDVADGYLTALADERDESSGSLRQLLGIPHLRKGLTLGVVSMQVTTSIWPVIYYSTEFLRRANIDFDVAETVSSAMMIVSTAATVIGMLVMERFSRRQLFIIVSVINMSAIVLFVLCSQLQKHTSFDVIKYGCVVAIFLHGTSYSFATGPVAWFITAELVPISFRALSQSIALASNQLMALLLTFVTLPLYNALDALALLPLFVLPTAAALVYLWLNLPETNNRDIGDIMEDLKNGTVAVPKGPGYSYEVAESQEMDGLKN